jgi:hypothetical protein
MARRRKSASTSLWIQERLPVARRSGRSSAPSSASRCGCRCAPAPRPWSGRAALQLRHQLDALGSVPLRASPGSRRAWRGSASEVRVEDHAAADGDGRRVAADDEAVAGRGDDRRLQPHLREGAGAGFSSAVVVDEAIVPRSSAERWWKRMRVCSFSGFALGSRSSFTVMTCESRSVPG